MKVLIACEESQTVCKEFRKLGHEAFSCDIQDCSGGHPEWHIKDDVLKVIDSEKWDLMIAHPPCTYLSNSGVSWLYNKDENKTRNEKRWQELKKASEFFYEFVNSKIPFKAIENPIPHKYGELPKYSQIIQPWQFGHTESKATCLWLYGLPKLKETNNVYKEFKSLPKNISQRLHHLPPGPERAKLRSKTYQGIAKAMAEQWGNI